MSNKPYSICLCMIVKNESKIIKRLLSSVLPIVTHYCICDTGSTDDTKEIITTFFHQHHIDGKIIEEPFKHFSYNRNIALHASYGLSDYILFMDADMVLSIKNKERFYQLLHGHHDVNPNNTAYTFSQGSSDFHYQNIRLIRSPIHTISLQHKISLYQYIGATHEYLSTPEHTNTIHIDKSILFINDLGDGGSKQHKFERDIELLTNDLKEHPNDPRTLFYLANSYSDVGNKEKAIDTYKKRIHAGGWYQEIWYSYYKIGNLYESSGSYEQALYYWFHAYSIIPERLENIYKIIKHYRENSTTHQRLAYQLYNTFVPKKPHELKRDHFLFLEDDVYSYKLYYEYMILAYYNNIKNVNNEMVYVLNNCQHASFSHSSLRNFKFYAKSLFCQKKICLNETFKWNEWTFTSSSASLIKFPSTRENALNDEKNAKNIKNTKNAKIPTNTAYIMNQRFVNYTINKDGSYPYYPTIATLNKCIFMDEEFTNLSFFIFQDDSNKSSKYYGVEDVRLYFSSDKKRLKERFSDKERFNEKKLLFNGTHYKKSQKIGVCYGIYDIFTEKKALLQPREIDCIQYPNSECEKNWVFVDISNQTHMIYKWCPLEIGPILSNNEPSNEPSKLNITIRKDMPSFFQHVRGSTNACQVFLYNKNGKMTRQFEWWFIGHIVSYESPRQYYHVLMKFDPYMNLKQYSAPFKFEDQQNEIEYCLGLVVEDERVLITYSNWDRTTTLGIYDRKYINEQMVYKCK